MLRRAFSLVPRPAIIALLIAALLMFGLLVAFFLHVELVARPAFEEEQRRPGGIDRPPRYFHCVELRRIQSRWFDYPRSTMWEQIDERYQRECPDHGLDVRDDIQWSPSLPPEPPPR